MRTRDEGAEDQNDAGDRLRSQPGQWAPEGCNCVPTHRTDLRQITAEVHTSPVRFELLRAPRIPPARIDAARRHVRDVSARSPSRSTSMFSTLQTLVRATVRSVPLGKCLSRFLVRLELSHLVAATASVSGPLGMIMSWFRPLLRPHSARGSQLWG